MLGKRIKKMMDVRDINLAELADKTKLSKGGLSMIINGKKNSVTTDSLNRIAKALNIYPSYFLEDDVLSAHSTFSPLDNIKKVRK